MKSRYLRRMNDYFLGFLDRFIPQDLRDFEQDEEIIRARALVFMISMVAVLPAPAILLVFLSTTFSDTLPPIHLITTAATVPAYVLALWLFKRTGLFIVSGNMFALIGYVSVLVIVISTTSQIYLMLGLLAVPVVVTVIANHTSALVWLALIAVAPEIVIYCGGRNLGVFFFYSWLAMCVGMAFALQVDYIYRENMRRRLHMERSQFEFAAAHDPLTGLANRATFERRLHECIESCELHGEKAALLYIDLDRFKPINDTYGHQAGDIVLSTVASRMRGLVRSSDTVARLGGDEFAVLLGRCDPDMVDTIASRIGEVVRQPIEAFGNRLTVDCSLGKVIYPDDGQFPDQLAHKADERMYAAKRD